MYLVATKRANAVMEAELTNTAVGDTICPTRFAATIPMPLMNAIARPASLHHW